MLSFKDIAYYKDVNDQDENGKEAHLCWYFFLNDSANRLGFSNQIHLSQLQAVCEWVCEGHPLICFEDAEQFIEVRGDDDFCSSVLLPVFRSIICRERHKLTFTGGSDLLR